MSMVTGIVGAILPNKSADSKHVPHVQADFVRDNRASSRQAFQSTAGKRGGVLLEERLFGDDALASSLYTTNASAHEAVAVAVSCAVAVYVHGCI